jgi:hypothetical protein
MLDQLNEAESRRRQVREVLLLHFQARGPLWPGADALTMQEILDNYPAFAAAGRVPGKEELLRRFPELAAELEAFFSPKT